MNGVDELPRKLGLLDATMIVIGIVIGSGIFLLPNLIAKSLPSPAAILGVWTATGILSVFGALAYAELGAMLPATGGQYVFLREAYGPVWAFLCGWVFVVAAAPGGIAFLAVGFSIYLTHFIPLSPGMRTVASLGLVAVLAAINYIGVRASAWTQRIFTLAKTAGLVIVISAAFLAAPSTAAAPDLPPLSYGGLSIAVTACLMAYNGWSYVSFVAGEVKNPQRNIPLALALSMGIVMVLYLAANVAYMKVFTVSQIAATERVGSDIAERSMGPIGGTILSLVVLTSVTGAINGCLLTASRIPFAQARDGIFFAPFARIHPRFRTPAFAIAAQAAWSGVLIVTGSYETLSSYTMIPAWLFYTLGAGAVWVLRRKMPDAGRPYRMWGYPGTLCIFLLASAWFIVDALVNQPIPSAAALLISAAGFPFYFFWRRRTPQRPMEARRGASKQFT